ncbi:type II toxin-antitoxin system RelB/DinJ family antitoxin [Candidatus Gracilibacteria bacterium]|nr:type II toxin-antitoxin system RelB/DinJ family antitoxin [Candidatus Gracilibacteria bacterium]
MTTTATSIRLNPQIKKQAQVISKKMGTNLSNVINMYLAQFVHEKRLNIVLRDEEGFTSEQSAEILHAWKDPNNVVTGEFTNAKDLMRHLDKLKKK